VLKAYGHMKERRRKKHWKIVLFLPTPARRWERHVEKNTYWVHHGGTWWLREEISVETTDDKLMMG